MNYIIIPQSAFTYIQSLGTRYPQYKDIIDKIDLEINQRLWYQLSLDILELCKKDDLKNNQELIPLYNEVIIHVEASFNPMQLLTIVKQIISNYVGKYNEALIFIDNLNKKLKFTGEEELFIILLKGYCYLELGNIYDLEDCLKKVKIEFEKRGEIDPIIYSNYYKLSTYFYNKKGDFDSFYFAALQYLGYEKNITEKEKKELCFNMCVATLIGEKMFNFAELIEKDFFMLMKDSEYEWIYNLIFSFNSAQVNQFEEMLQNYKNQIESVPILKSNELFLHIKIRISAFLELIFQKNKGERVISFKEIKEKCFVDDNQTEYIIMKALSFGLIKGFIDQVEECVHVTWVIPKYLDKDKIAIVMQRFDSWISKSKDILTKFQDISSSLLV